jgi:hypothetical protein
MLTDLTRLDMKEYKKLEKLCSFKIENLLKKQITNEIKIFLSLIPDSEVPSFSL